MSLTAEVAVVARRLRSSPGYTLGTVITLALALGANTAIFGVVDSTLLNPLAARDPYRVVVVWESDPPKSVAVVELAYNTFRDWATHSRSFSHAGAFGSSSWTEILRGVDESVRLASTAVSATFFDTLDARPLLGRTFRDEDDVPNAERVMILSHRLWKTRALELVRGRNHSLGDRVRERSRSHHDACIVAPPRVRHPDRSRSHDRTLEPALAA